MEYILDDLCSKFHRALFDVWFKIEISQPLYMKVTDVNF